jgi:hypothetical protein
LAGATGPALVKGWTHRAVLCCAAKSEHRQQPAVRPAAPTAPTAQTCGQGGPRCRTGRSLCARPCRRGPARQTRPRRWQPGGHAGAISNHPTAHRSHNQGIYVRGARATGTGNTAAAAQQRLNRPARARDHLADESPRAAKHSTHGSQYKRKRPGKPPKIQPADTAPSAPEKGARAKRCAPKSNREVRGIQIRRSMAPNSWIWYIQCA